MGTKSGLKFSLLGAVALSVLLAQTAAQAQSNTVELSPIDVASSRLAVGIVGASTTVVTADDIARSPDQTLTGILSQQAGIQTQHLFGGVNGARDTVDLRGFGAFASSNTLVLVNGRRFQDFDLQGFDFSTIPVNSVERIEITRGNSGTVLYGDGAVGGVINIVTKTKSASGVSGKVEVLAGSYNYWEGRQSLAATSGPWSVNLFTNEVTTGGYRDNSKGKQYNFNANLAYTQRAWSAYLNVSGDSQKQGLAGGLNNNPGNYPYTLTTPQRSITPLDNADRQAFNITTGFTANLGSGIDLIVDGGVRRKFQQGLFYNYLDAGFAYNAAAATPMNYVDTVMTTTSLTPRLDIAHDVFGGAGRLLTGIDFYHTQYGSDRPAAQGLVPVHTYDIRQTTAAIYAMNTTQLRPDTDLSFGGRLQHNAVKAVDTYSAVNDPGIIFGPYPNNPQAPNYDKSEWQYAAHLGLEHRLSQSLAVFGRVARAFRLGNADERVGAGSPFAFAVPTFDLKTQTSYDIEGGARVTAGKLQLQSSVYLMKLNNEIQFIPALGVNTNLDPTQRVGWETFANYELTNSVRLKGNVSYVNATFRSGPYSGNNVPLVSRWSGAAGVTWDIMPKALVLDVTTRFFGERRMDNDQLNQQPKIPAQATVDVKLGGQYDRFNWSVGVLNLFDRQYFDYSIASGGIAGGPGFPAGLPPTPGAYSAYPLPGRTFVVQAGMTF